MGIVEIAANNLLVSGVVIASVTITLFAILAHFGQTKPDSWLLADNVTYVVYAPVITVASTMGIGMAAKGAMNLATQPVSGGGWAVVAASVIVTAVVFYLLSLSRSGTPAISNRNVAVTQ